MDKIPRTNTFDILNKFIYLLVSSKSAVVLGYRHQHSIESQLDTSNTQSNFNIVFQW